MNTNFNPKILFTKIRNVKSPNRAHPTDAGTDFYIPEYDKEFLEALIIKNANNRIFYNPIMEKEYDENGKVVREYVKDLEVVIPSGEQVNIPCGIKVWIIDKRTFLQATNKSGIASNFHLDVMANTIDANYQGEMHLNLVNTGNTTVIIKTGQKLVQMIHKEYIDSDFSEISNEDYNKIGQSDRGDGGFSSTGIY